MPDQKPPPVNLTTVDSAPSTEDITAPSQDNFKTPQAPVDEAVKCMLIVL